MKTRSNENGELVAEFTKGEAALLATLLSKLNSLIVAAAAVAAEAKFPEAKVTADDAQGLFRLYWDADNVAKGKPADYANTRTMKEAA